jgi:hypothetical protein
VRRFLRFNRVTGNQDRHCSVCVGRGALPFTRPAEMPNWEITRTHLPRCRTFVPAQMCTRRSRPSNLNPLTIKIGPTYFSTPVPFDRARRGPWACTGGGRATRCSVVRTRNRVAGVGYACSARPDTVCRSFPKISSELGARFCGGSTSAKKP